MPTTEATLWPMIAHAALVFFLYWLLSRRRFAAVKTGSIEAGQFRENREEPVESLHGFFLLVPDPNAFDAIFRAVRVA